MFIIGVQSSQAGFVWLSQTQLKFYFGIRTFLTTVGPPTIEPLGTDSRCHVLLGVGKCAEGPTFDEILPGNVFISGTPNFRSWFCRVEFDLSQISRDMNTMSVCCYSVCVDIPCLTSVYF